MQIHARVALSLPNKFYRTFLKYDTYQKATYDSYLIAALVKNAKNKKAAMNYIDEISGNGSLNPHFKKLYEEISEFTPEQIDGILKNSLYPVTMMEKGHFKYYEMFNATRFNDKVYDGNLRFQEEFLKERLLPKEDGIKFLSLEFEEGEGTIKKDTYDAVFSDEGISVNLDNNQYYPISKEDFYKVYEVENLDLSEYQGDVGSKITVGQWYVLTQSVLDSYKKDQFCYKDKNGNYAVILSDYIKITEVINVFDLHFYKETKYEFTKGNKEIIEEALKQLLDNGWANNYKVKSLVKMLFFVNDEIGKAVVEYILKRKDSKEVAEFGMKIIKSGFVKGWPKEVLLSIKRSVNSSDYKYLYLIDSDLGFVVEDFLDIDDADLIEIHRMQKKAYLEERKNLIKDITLWLGEICSVSGIRERSKKLQKNQTVITLNEFIKKYSAHSRIDWDSKSTDELKKEHEYIKNIYNGVYQKVLAAVKKKEEGDK